MEKDLESNGRRKVSGTKKEKQEEGKYNWFQHKIVKDLLNKSIHKDYLPFVTE